MKKVCPVCRDEREKTRDCKECGGDGYVPIHFDNLIGIPIPIPVHQ